VDLKSKDKNEKKANNNENKQINPTSETPLKPEELLTSPLRTEEKEKEEEQVVHKPEENADKEQKEKEEHAQQVLQQQSQKESNKNKQNHSALRRYGKWLAVLGGALGYSVAVGFAAGFSAFDLLYFILFVLVGSIAVNPPDDWSNLNFSAFVLPNRNKEKENKEEQKNSEEGSTI